MPIEEKFVTKSQHEECDCQRIQYVLCFLKICCHKTNMNPTGLHSSVLYILSRGPSFRMNKATEIWETESTKIEGSRWRNSQERKSVRLHIVCSGSQ